MSRTFQEEWKYLLFGLLAAALFWVELFRWQLTNFWMSIGLATALLSVFALWRVPGLLRLRHPWGRTLFLAATSAGFLYALFWLGAWATAFLPFQKEELTAIYQNKVGTSPALIALLMIFVVGPGEEIFWRGYVQGTLEKTWRGVGGWLLASFFYTAAHFASANLMLVGAAATAGLFWGWLYWRAKNLWANILSHVLWDITIFLLFPIQ
jgi:membrane protease YdiL (CAAX protease family)